MKLDMNQKMLLHLLSCAIKNITPNIEREHCDWSIVYSLASSHMVDTFLYPVIKQLKSLNNNIVNQWCIDALLKTFAQVEKMEQTNSIICEYEKANIDIILLKGIVLRNLYPFPELRTMSDIDILLRKEDLIKGVEILRALGYKEKSTDYRVSAFVRPNLISVELHTNLLYPDQFKEMRFLEDRVWDSKEMYSTRNKSTYVITTEFNIAYLILHAFIHFSQSGVGLRQLCDIAILIDKNLNKINWKVFWNLIITAKKQNFALIILISCIKFLNIKIDSEYLPILKEVQNEYVDTFIIELIQGGVFGGFTKGRAVEMVILHKSNRMGINRSQFFINVLRELAFPKVSDLSDRYIYAKKNPLLLPVAWVYRILFYVFRQSAFTFLYLKKLYTLSYSKKRKSYLKSIDFVK